MRGLDDLAPGRREVSQDEGNVGLLWRREGGAAKKGGTDVLQAQPGAGLWGSQGRWGEACGVRGQDVVKSVLQEDRMWILGSEVQDTVKPKLEESCHGVPGGWGDDGSKVPRGCRVGDNPGSTWRQGGKRSGFANLMLEEICPRVSSMPEDLPARLRTHRSGVRSEVRDSEASCSAGQQRDGCTGAEVGRDGGLLDAARGASHKRVDSLLHCSKVDNVGFVKGKLVDSLGGNALDTNVGSAQEVGARGLPSLARLRHAAVHFAESRMHVSKVVVGQGDAEVPEIAVNVEDTVAGPSVRVHKGWVNGGVEGLGARDMLQDRLCLGLGRVSRGGVGLESREDDSGELVRVEHWDGGVVSEGEDGRGRATGGEGKRCQPARALQRGEIGDEDLAGDVPLLTAEGTALGKARSHGEGGGEEAIDADGAGGPRREDASPSDDAIFA
jgi:hypothetical protein